MCCFHKVLVDIKIMQCFYFYLPPHSTLYSFYACVHACVRASVRACVRVCVTSTRQTWEKPSLTCTNKWNVLQELRRHSIIVTVCTIPDVYHAGPQGLLGRSDHAMVCLIPTYMMQKLNSDKRLRKTVKKWTQEAVSSLQGCFDCTAWSMFSDSCADQDEYADSYLLYQFLYRLLQPLKDCHNLCKWQTLVLKGHQTQIHCKNTDKGQYKAAKYEAEKAIRRAKAQYQNKLEKHFLMSNSHAVWQGLQQITQYKQKPTPTNNDPTLPDQLNHFYSIFDRTPPKLQATLALSRLFPQTQIQVSHHLPSLSSYGRWKISSQS